ncbi:MAG: BatA domain-containing protein [Deltaproteobacteria bacterium]|nr:BatA domain-containing protein [Deltaproteobacteria bacterium]
MKFSNSIFLYALILGVIPIIIHFLKTKQPINEVFSPLPIVLKVKKRIIKKKMIHSLLLLILRVLFVLISVVTFAGMYVEYPIEGSDNTKRCLIIIDNSPSTEANIDGMTIKDRLVKMAEEYVSKNSNFCSRVTLLTLSDNNKSEFAIEEVMKDGLSKKVLRGYRPVTFEKDVVGLFSILDEEKYSKVGLFSDFYSHFAENKENMIQYIKRRGIDIPILNLPPISNAFISLINVEDFDERVIRLIVSVENGGESPFYGDLQLYDNGSLIERLSINISPMDKADISFEISGDKYDVKEHYFVFKLNGDSFEYDNVEYFYYRVGRRGKILIVNGEPSPDETKSEIFFIVNALKSYFGESVKIYTVLEDMIPETPELYDVIFLANVSSLERLKADILYKYIIEGGKVFISLGNRINIGGYNELRFMPAEIIGVTDAEKDEYLLVEDDLFYGWRHDIMANLRKVKIYKYFKVAEKERSDVIIRTSNKKPILISKNYGKGLVMLYTTSLDMDMNDFPIRKSYLPLFTNILNKMLDELFRKVIINSNIGEEVSFNVSNCYEDIVFKSDSEIFRPNIICRDNTSEGRVVKFTAPYNCGFYELDDKDQSVVLVVNANKFESQMKRIDIPAFETNSNQKKDTGLIVASDMIRSGKFSLVEFLLIILGCILMLEMFIINRR